MRFPLSTLTLERPSGRVAGGIDFEVFDQDTDTQQPVYLAAVGSTEIASPESDANGHPAGFVESGSYYLHSPDDRFVDQNFEAVTARDLGGRMIGYGEITSDSTLTGTTRAEGSVPLLMEEVLAPSRAVVVTFRCGQVQLSVASGLSAIYLMKSVAGAASYSDVAALTDTFAGTNGRQSVSHEFPPMFDLDEGTLYDFKIQMQTGNGSHVITLHASAINAASDMGPCYLLARTI